MYRKYIILIIIIINCIMISGCNIKTTSAGIENITSIPTSIPVPTEIPTTFPTDTSSDSADIDKVIYQNTKPDKIEIKLKEHTNKDNVVPEILNEFNKNNIAKIYYKKEYINYEFIVCLDNNDTLNIIYLKDDKYFSICQLSNWTIEDQYIYEHAEGNGITDFNNVLGYSGIKIELINGATSIYIFYIIINDDIPSLLLSDSLSGEFSEFDIDDDGEKELLAFDGYMYTKMDNKLYRATYDYDKTRINQVVFKDELEHYIVYFVDGTIKEYKYDSQQKCLIEILN